MRIRGIQDERMRLVVTRTLESPEWEFAGMTGTTHGVLRHIPSGETVTFGTTPRGGAFKTVAQKIRRISGLVVLPQAKHGSAHRERRPATAPEVSARAARDRARFAAEAKVRARERDLREIADLMRPG